MPSFPFKQVDVFTKADQGCKFRGNPVAVIFDLQGQLEAEQMQLIANWTNLSETTFAVPKTAGTGNEGTEADYRVRIFTPQAELPFAGHPTIGTAHALLEAGLLQASMDGKLVQECKAGLIKLNVANGWIELAMPEPSSIRKLNAIESQQLEGMLGAGPLLLQPSSPLLVDVGPRWIVAQLADANAVLAAQPDFERIKVLSEQVAATGITIFGEWKASHVNEDVGHQDAAPRIEVRSFAPLHGVPEDPVCGSGCGAVGLFIQRSGQRVHFGGKDGQQPLTLMASQGRTLGRDGQVRITWVDMGNGQTEEVRVGGQAVTCIDGQLML